MVGGSQRGPTTSRMHADSGNVELSCRIACSCTTCLTLLGRVYTNNHTHMFKNDKHCRVVLHFVVCRIICSILYSAPGAMAVAGRVIVLTSPLLLYSTLVMF
ncbi:hypothetical protein COO60DRAFT_1568736 [Scenedesmus sp. NREL 46B-D3]|nr:hypothetical protein COO60DRAFT_1568736 [Scenedesmus sp. NREL 46B-D3]